MKANVIIPTFQRLLSQYKFYCDSVRQMVSVCTIIAPYVGLVCIKKVKLKIYVHIIYYEATCPLIYTWHAPHYKPHTI